MKTEWTGTRPNRAYRAAALAYLGDVDPRSDDLAPLAGLEVGLGEHGADDPEGHGVELVDGGQHGGGLLAAALVAPRPHGAQALVRHQLAEQLLEDVTKATIWRKSPCGSEGRQARHTAVSRRAVVPMPHFAGAPRARPENSAVSTIKRLTTVGLRPAAAYHVHPGELLREVGLGDFGEVVRQPRGQAAVD